MSIRNRRKTRGVTTRTVQRPRFARHSQLHMPLLKIDIQNVNLRCHGREGVSRDEINKKGQASELDQTCIEGQARQTPGAEALLGARLVAGLKAHACTRTRLQPYTI